MIDTDRFVVISGCSGGGKSSLLDELRRRGHVVVPEPGRRIVAEALATGGAALPWVDPEGFARRAIDMALMDRAAVAPSAGWVFFDRGLIDAANALDQSGRDTAVADLGSVHRYHRRVFLAPPWPEIYASDAERRHDFATAVAEYHQLVEAYATLGYTLTVLPQTTVPARADFVLRTLGDAPTVRGSLRASG